MAVCWANYNILGCDQERGTTCCVENLTVQIAWFKPSERYIVATSENESGSDDPQYFVAQGVSERHCGLVRLRRGIVPAVREAHATDRCVFL